MPKKTLIIILIVAAVLVGLLASGKIHLKSAEGFAQPVGTLRTTPQSELQSHVDDFMVTQGSEHDLGKENYQCSSTLYGYDDKYAYAWVYCSGFTLKTNGELEQGTAISAPARLEYTDPHFQIVAFERPGDGGNPPTLKQLFPKEMYDLAQADNGGTDNLELKLLNKVKAIVQIKAQYPELNDYPSDKLPPRSIMTEEGENDLYIAFVQNGSGIPVIGARCFHVGADGTIAKNGTFAPTLGNDGFYFSARTCNSATTDQTPTPSIAPTQSPEPTTASAGSITVSLGEKFTLKKGGIARVKDRDATLQLKDFIYSPCPKNVQCIWSGLAVIYELTVNGKTYDSSFGNPPQGAPYDVSVVESDYKTYATFIITKKGATP